MIPQVAEVGVGGGICKVLRKKNKITFRKEIGEQRESSEILE